jgi:MinD superfamily P-loop ATPase
MHDLGLAVEMVSELGLQMGVVVNRDGTGYHELEEFCALEGLPILLRIPFDRRIAEATARGKTLIDVQPEYLGLFRGMIQDVVDMVSASGPTWPLLPSMSIPKQEDMRAIRPS